jgi:DNA transformation protein
MKQRDEFITYLLELMQPLGPVSARAMFGGYGIYLDDIMFALVADDILYLKTNKETLPEFEQRGLQPFRYKRKGKPFNLSYSEAPDDVMEDHDAMHYWANKAIEAALKNKRSNKTRKKPG